MLSLALALLWLPSLTRIVLIGNLAIESIWSHFGVVFAMVHDLILPNVFISGGRGRRSGGLARRVLRMRRDGSGSQLHDKLGNMPRWL